MSALKKTKSHAKNYLRKIKGRAKNDLKKINLLPYHRIANGKYQKLKLENRMKEVQQHSKEELNKIKRFFTDAGLNARIGG